MNLKKIKMQKSFWTNTGIGLGLLYVFVQAARKHENDNEVEKDIQSLQAPQATLFMDQKISKKLFEKLLLEIPKTPSTTRIDVNIYRKGNMDQINTLLDALTNIPNSVSIIIHLDVPLKMIQNIHLETFIKNHKSFNELTIIPSVPFEPFYFMASDASINVSNMNDDQMKQLRTVLETGPLKNLSLDIKKNEPISDEVFDQFKKVALQKLVFCNCIVYSDENLNAKFNSLYNDVLAKNKTPKFFCHKYDK